MTTPSRPDAAGFDLSALPVRSCVLAPDETLRYRVCGHGPRTVVLLHGLAARAETWADIVPYFPPERYTLYLLDLLGSGESSKPAGADYSIPGHGARFIRFLHRERLTDVICAGHSLGGAITLYAAVEAFRSGETGLFRSLAILAGPGYPQRLPLFADILLAPLAAWLFIRLPTPDLFVRLGLRTVYHDQRLDDPEHLRRYAPCYGDRESRRALVETCRKLAPSGYDEIIGAYRSLPLPVLLLWGRQDRIVPLVQGERLAGVLPHSLLEVFDGCGHNPHEERPEETFHGIDHFVSAILGLGD